MLPILKPQTRPCSRSSHTFDSRHEESSATTTGICSSDVRITECECYNNCVTVSVEKFGTVTPQLEGKFPSKINLINEQVVFGEDAAVAFSLETWPILLFLKG